MKNLYFLKKGFSFTLIICFLVCASLTVKAQPSMRANLYTVNAGTLTIADGNFTQYNEAFNNEVDIEDIPKMINPEINFGIFRAATNLVVERRNTSNYSDTTFFRMWNMPRKDYRLKLILSQLERTYIKAVIKDNYLNTETIVDLNDTTEYNFTIDTNASSGSEMRFELIYFAKKPVVIVPDVIKPKAAINVYPNPVVNKIVHIEFADQLAGKYTLTLVHSNGLQQPLSPLYISGIQSFNTVNLPGSTAVGIYYLMINTPDKKTIYKTIYVK